MQSDPAARRRRRRREEAARLSEFKTSKPQTEKQAAGEHEEDEEAAPRGRGHRPGDAERRRAESEESGRWRINQLEKEKLEVTSKHNQQLCLLEAELARLRSAVERGEAQRAELQYQLTVTHRDAEQAAKLQQDKHTLTERAAQLQCTIQELQKVVDITQKAREKDQHALQQEVDERDQLFQSCNTDNHQLRHLLQEHEEALEAATRRLADARVETERGAEVNRQLTEREETGRRERQACEQRLEALEAGLEAERAAHRQSKFSAEVVQLRVQDLEAVLAMERCGQQEAQRKLELLRAELVVERERSGRSQQDLERLQQTTSDLKQKLQEEKRQHAETHTLLEQAAAHQSSCEQNFNNFVSQVTHTLQQLSHAGCDLSAKDDGNLSPSAGALLLLNTTISSFQTRQEAVEKQVQELLLASELLVVEKQTLSQLNWDQSRRVQESQQEVARLQDQLAGLNQERQALQAELQREGEELQTLKEELQIEGEELQTLKEELQREREERSTEVEKVTDHCHKQSEASLSFLHSMYQRLLAGFINPQSILGKFSWEELCDVINKQVDQLTSDLHNANCMVAHLQSVCEKKSVCVQELQHSQECVLSHLEESVKRREEEWSSCYTRTVARLQSELQLCRSECGALRERLTCATSDLSRLQRLLSARRGEAASFLSACALLAGAMAHTRRRLQALCQQKRLLGRQLAAREQLELEVRRLAMALGGVEPEEGAEPPGRRRWRRSVRAVMAASRWHAVAKQTTVLFRLDRGDGGVAVCVSGDIAMATQKGTGDDADATCVHWLRSKRLSSSVLAAMADLQGALGRHASSPADVMSAARSSLSRLLDHIDQSDEAFSSIRVDECDPPPPSAQALVSRLQQHFLLFSQRLHAAEVERRSLRLELANLKRPGHQTRDDFPRTVLVQRFHSVCVELRQALSREEEAQVLLQNQSVQLAALQLQVHTRTAEHDHIQHRVVQAAQSASAARQQASQRERSLRIVGKHLSGVQREKKQLEERLRQAEEELRDAARRRESVMSCMEAAEQSYKEVREGLVQSYSSLSDQPPSLPLPREHLELSRAESIMGAPEVAACQSLLFSISQLLLTCIGRIDWLQQEVSAHRSHVTALRSELQDACLRDNCARDPLFPNFLFDDVKAPPLRDVVKQPTVTVSPALSQTGPTPCPQLPKPTRIISKGLNATKSNKGQVEVNRK